MGQILIYWAEIEDGEFPDCCLTCGAEETHLVPRRLETFHYRVLTSYRKYITVDLPFCRAHRSRPWIKLGRTEASEFTQEGVWIKNVSDLFVEEMEALRDVLDEEDEKPRRLRKHKKKRQRSVDDRDEPFSQPRQPSRRSLIPYLVVVVLLVPLVLFGLFGMCCLAGIIFPGVKFGAQPEVQGPPQGPNFNNRPPFGPGGRRP